MILGLDISTSITGVAVVADEQLLYYDSIDLRKHKDVFAKATEMKEKIMDQNMSVPRRPESFAE